MFLIFNLKVVVFPVPKIIVLIQVSIRADLGYRWRRNIDSRRSKSPVKENVLSGVMECLAIKKYAITSIGSSGKPEIST